MTAADKFGIAISIGFTVALIAFAMSFSATGKSAPVAPIPAPSAPMPVDIPAPAEEAPEEMIVEETPAEVPEEEVPEEEAPVEETPEEVPTEEEPVMEEEHSEMVMSADVSIPEGSSTPGCEADNACYIEPEVTVSVGATVTWTNDDTAAHTVTSGTPTDGPDGVFDSSIVMSGATFEHTFEEEGDYDYFCIVHPWMTGKVIVE
jgi:plastocyanin